MLYGSQPTKALGDRACAPRESLQLARSIILDDRFTGAAGRDTLRHLLGREHEKSNSDIPGMRGFPVWRYVLQDRTVHAAPNGFAADGLPTVYILGPTAKNFISIEATQDTSGVDAAVILTEVAAKLGIRSRP